jgi:hypothetical protein
MHPSPPKARRAATEKEGAPPEPVSAGIRADLPPGPSPADKRQPFDWHFGCGGTTWPRHFEPNPRDVRQWRVFRDGQPWPVRRSRRVHNPGLRAGKNQGRSGPHPESPA